ncbi:hypothetical protein KC367_g3536 [Hortaea werneckii]|uniref:Ecp2 effector protein domain-containing protein n=1 Tax=Hortaea werneckii EXF-2000 TaxID=1157616 RepID=A0A1Z5SMX2_HORWE|nr:hypothetical protein KC358_g10206 [Hortaea werneckii]OTA22078.1 hypothetical protein BTJ68_14749 [Hortaea werneckii EXF-2000]KAI6818787.1 hypothetical protein KC342_g14372 [Hortaea werneckii]KAI6825229.1 hypothetical protein KC350_g8837 [Hortaea werneckii]KAI6920525.1 hypothetical protein KC348_g10358 [Hortaea werneckii]
MQPQKVLLAAGLFALASAEGFRVVHTRDTEKLPLPEADMSYIGPAFDGGDDVEVQGTIESVAAQLREINPDWHPGVVGKNTPSKTDSAKRAEISPPLCNDDLGGQRYARTAILSNGADYLKGLSGVLRQPARSCGRVSCSYDAGVTFCNDGNEAIPVAAAELGRRVDGIVGLCGDGGTRMFTKGQVFDTDDWNVIAARSDC